MVSGGTRLSVREHGSPAPGRPTLVLVHGYPDQQDVWDPLVAVLRGRGCHVVTYDVRGAGASDVPPDVASYRLPLLVADLTAVVEATVPQGRPVHLVGHDWGSVQLWDAVDGERGDPGLLPRVASFTSVSGPSLDQVARVARRLGHRPRMLRQAARSWYVYAFHLPVLPELVWNRGHGLAARVLRAAEGPEAAHWGPELAANAVHGLALYRANVRERARRPGALHTDVPVLVVQPRRDHFVGEVLLEGLDEACTDLTVRHVDAGHWLVRTHAEELGALLDDHIRHASR